jgi:DNA (cytosine-5)-methyltransferase 1
MTAYYNEHDPFAAAWLRELIADGLIAPGEVDERSIEDVRPDELAGFVQCHFFAGIGVWSLALRQAGVPDDYPLWTGSCPCQPFSAAGKGAGTADERHLWPAWEHLIRECRPAVLFGEQVASKAAGSWADLVQDDLEALGYAFGAVPFPAASVGAPHIRDRLYWLADLAADRRREERAHGGGFVAGDSAQGRAAGLEPSGSHSRMANNNNTRRLEHAQRDGEPVAGREAAACGDDVGGRGELGDASSSRGGRNPGAFPGEESRAERGMWSELDFAEFTSRVSALADSSTRLEVLGEQQARGQRAASERGGEASFWDGCEFVWCRDEKWRPVEPGSFPLAHGAPERVGRLRGYGNAIVSEAAKVFIEASGLL